jgi:hypothetical protein
MKTYWGSGGIGLSILTSAVDGDEWTASRPGRFPGGVKARHQLDGRLGGPTEPVWRRWCRGTCRKSEYGSSEQITEEKISHTLPLKDSVLMRGPFEKFVASPYHSESKLCGGAVTVSFSKYLTWQPMPFLQRSIHFPKTCCRPFAAGFRRIVEQAVLTFRFRFSVSEALPPLEPQLVSLHRLHRLDGWVVGFQNSITQSWRSTKEISSCSALLKGILFKTTVTQTLTTVRGLKITPLLSYPHHYKLA